ncbi:MAG: tetratricopeptide repeat protein, partial [Acidobacteria bacterium]|nr:tetratricopeptide repeat protein [Acidobacteriota bacterium]
MTALAVDQQLLDSGMMSRERVRRLLRTTEQKLRAVETACFGVGHTSESYSVGQLNRLRMVAQLLDGITAQQFRKQIEALALRESVADPLSEFKLRTKDGRVLVDLPDGTSIDAESGQLMLDLDHRLRPSSSSTALSFPTTALAAKEDQRKRQEAEEWFEKALELEQTGAPPEDIRDAYEKAIELDPKSTGALVNLGTIFFSMRSFGKAEKLYLRAVDVDPEYALAHFNLGNLYDERGDAVKALQHYTEALRINPQYPDAH